MIYVDGDHVHEMVVRDAPLAHAKIKDDGIIIFNDYIMCDYTGEIPYGVVQVVNK